MLFEFRLWLEDEETYRKKFKPRAEKAAARLGKHPFQHWFPEGAERVVIPLRTPALSAASHFLQSTDYFSPEDKELIRGLTDMGYEVTDYRGGYVKRGHGVEKIGGLLEKLMKAAPTETDREKIRRWQLIFVNSAARKDKSMDGSSDMWVLISRNAHDIAQMSYDREWTSCMELEDGHYKNTPFCVIRTGGMVAYLLRTSEASVRELAGDMTKYVKNPIARMSIKAAVNAQDKTQIIAVPETRVYPQNIRGFYETVFDWVEQHQGDMGSGKFRVLGGYSDDYGGSDKYRVHHRPSRNADQLMSWLNSHIEARQEAAIKHVLDSRLEYPEEIYRKIKTILLSKMFVHVHNEDNIVNKQMLYLFKRFPEMFTEDDKRRLSYFVKDKADLLGRHDRVVYEYAKKFGSSYVGGKLNKPETGDIRKLQHHLGEIADGKTKFKDDVSFNKLVDYVSMADGELTSLYTRSLAHYTAVSPHRVEMLGDLDGIIDSLLDMLGKQNKLTDISEYNRYNSVGYAVERLVKTALQSRRLTAERVKKISRVIELLVEAGNTFTVRGEFVMIIKGQIPYYQNENKPEVAEALSELHNWIDGKFPVSTWGSR